MNEFHLYQQLCVLEGIANQYPKGVSFGKTIREIADRIVSQHYRVAVIGEFKRGKSSLVNAIIGAQVLPTDILPMTAAVTRVTYGEKRRILVAFKDGHQEERTVEELVDFATKFDAEKEKTAQRIREIQVFYPSVFCKNRIDILDTPGLNDNEAMQEVTLSVLQDIDAAIMVISAKAPLSLTEQNLILDMIGNRQIRHIVFAVTHIDAVSNRPKEQDKIIAFIENRLRTELLATAETRWAQDAYYLEKARRILSRPYIFGVSAVLAMEGFICDDEQLLEQSRFPHFKNELLALLTAAQSEDVRTATQEAVAQAARLFPQWVTAASEGLEAQQAQLNSHKAAYNHYIQQAEPQLTEQLRQTHMALAQKGMDENGVLAPQIAETLCRCFIAQLGAIREHTNTDANLWQALQIGAGNARTAMGQIHNQIWSVIMERMQETERWLLRLRQPVGFGACETLQPTMAIPLFRLADTSLALQNESLQGKELMPRIRKAVETALVQYGRETKAYIICWKTALYDRIKKDCNDTVLPERYSAKQQNLEYQRSVLQVNRTQDRQKLEGLLEILEQGMVET